MPAIQDYIDVFTKEVKQGNDIICLCITTKFSGSYNSAMSARDIVLEEYPNNKITVIDTQINTVLQGLLVEEVVRMKEANYSYDQVVNRIEEIKGSGRIFFTIDSMAYLVNGGRVGKLSGIAANVLNLRPLIILKNGEIESNGVVRGRKKAKSKIIEMVINHFIENNLNPNDYSFAVGFGYDMEEAIFFKNELLSKINESFIYQEDIPLRQIGATIGVHTGPLPIGVGLIKKFNK